MKGMKRVLFTIFFMLWIAFCLPQSLRADDGTGIDDGGAFDDIDGLESYECYYFDVEKLDILDAFYSAVNAVGNVVWSIIKLLTKLVMSMLYYALNFDAGEILSPFLSGISESMHDTIFEPLFTLAFCGTAIILLKRMLKRDTMGAVGDILKVLVIVIVSIALVDKSDEVLSWITQITKEVSVEVMVGVNDSAGVSASASGDSTTDFALTAAELLWKNLVEEPWKSLEFAGTDPTEDEVKEFLNIANLPGSDNRASLVENYGGASVCFSKTRTLSRLGAMLVYFIPFLVKCVLYMAVAAIQLIMQVMTVIYVMIAPIILLLALLPGYESIVSTWLHKVLEAQLGVLLITFLLGIIIKIDNSLFEMLDTMGGFLVVTFLQMGILVGIYLGRNKIMGILSAVPRMTPQSVSRALNRLDLYEARNIDLRKGDYFLDDVEKYENQIDSQLKEKYYKEQAEEQYYDRIRGMELDEVKYYQRSLWKELHEDAAAGASEQKEHPRGEWKGTAKAGNGRGRQKQESARQPVVVDPVWQEAGEAPRMQPEETESGGEGIYAGYGEIDASQKSKRVIIKKKNSELKNGLPLRSEYPNVAMDKTDDEGHVYQRRLYDDNRMADRDFDTTDHGKPKTHPTGAHKHIFQGEKRGAPQALSEEELEENNDIIQKGVNYHDKGRVD
ncbi:MAG: CD3337/EF1877 family mobilome membrane protein [Lachnospiraceae bacterium]